MMVLGGWVVVGGGARGKGGERKGEEVFILSFLPSFLPSCGFGKGWSLGQI